MNAKKLARGAITAALYALITVAIAPISSGLMQLRLSEGLCVLPFFAPETAIGLFVGCVAANLITGAMWLDVVFGSLATLAAGLITAMIGKRGLSKWIAPLPAVIINALVIGAVLCYGYKVGAEYYACALYVALGEAISCYAVGMPVCAAIRPIEKKLFG